MSNSLTDTLVILVATMCFAITLDWNVAMGIGLVALALKPERN